MILDFEFFLTAIVILTGLLSLIDVIWFAPRRKKAGTAAVPLVFEYSRSFFPVLLVVLILRSFVAEPYRIPSGSDKPTLKIGDFILVNKYIYGLRLPVLRTKFFSNEDPKRGDIMVFHFPKDESIYYIKRVIGLPGDRISYVNKVLFINGEEAKQTLLGKDMDLDESGQMVPVLLKEENINGVKHKIYIRPENPAEDFSVIVPAGSYFTMGDNRDDSNDSRYWGFVADRELMGKASWILFSWDNLNHTIRWQRSGMKIN